MWTDHLVALVARAEAAAARIATAPAQARAGVAFAARRESARLSARLDASPLTDATADAVDAREEAGLPLVDGLPAREPALALDPTGGWARVLRLEGMATQDVAAVEYANLLTSADLEPSLADAFLDRPLGVLARLHGEVCRGLVDPPLLGHLRRSDQAVHDGAQGRVVYRAADAGALPRLLDEFANWVTERGGGLPALAVAGAVQERLLEWQPFEAGNGRVARAASRIVLRARGLDPEGIAVPERVLSEDRAGYHAEVAATRRRRGDLSLWLERYGEALADGLEAAADALVPLPALPAPARARAVLATAEGDTITVRDYALLGGVSLATARADLERLTRAGLLRLDPRTRGLRYRRASSGPVLPATL